MGMIVCVWELGPAVRPMHKCERKWGEMQQECILQYLLKFSLCILPLPSSPVWADIKISACWGFATGKKAKIVKILQPLRSAVTQERVSICIFQGDKAGGKEGGDLPLSNPDLPSSGRWGLAPCSGHHLEADTGPQGRWAGDAPKTRGPKLHIEAAEQSSSRALGPCATRQTEETWPPEVSSSDAQTLFRHAEGGDEEAPAVAQPFFPPAQGENDLEMMWRWLMDGKPPDCIN